MMLRGLTAAVLGLGLLAPGASALANESEFQVAAYFPVYDRVVDPMTAAIRAALADAGQVGDYLDKRDTAGVAAFYAAQGYAPTWTANGRLTERAKALIARIHRAEEDGLEAVYRTPALGMGGAVPAPIGVAARAEILLSTALVAYARHAQTGRLNPGDLSPNFDYDRALPDPVDILRNLSTTRDDPAAALAAYNPTHPEFLALRDKLAEMRAAEVELPPVVPPGTMLKLGSRDARVVILRERLGITAAAAEPSVFDETVDEAVRTFQADAGLKADGIVGPGTLGALNSGAADRIPIILANMERWRWMPRDLGRFYVRVNVPNYNLEIYRDGEVVYTTRVVVGEIKHQTPVFSHEMDHVVVNPTWNVPVSIATRSMLPKLQAAGGAVSGYQFFANINGRFQQVDPTMIDWHNVDMRRIQIKQPPGNANALGSIKFMFPNKHAVYLHDTPSKSYFERDFRALSNGCVRVMNPWEFTEALLQLDPEVSADGLKKMIGGREARVNLTNKIPVHLTYFTAWVDASGELIVRDDIYGHDARLEKAFGV